MQRFRFHLRISAAKYLDYYRGAALNVVATCYDGRTIQFPASLLTPFVTPEGIEGVFELTCDDANKGAELRKL